MISKPKNTPVIGALKVAAIPPAAPQATMIRSRLSDIRTNWPIVEAAAEPIWTIGPSRPTEPPVPMQSADATRLDDRDGRADAPAVLRHREHHLRHAVPARLPREAIDQGPVQKAADHRDHEQEPDPERRESEGSPRAPAGRTAGTRSQAT